MAQSTKKKQSTTKTRRIWALAVTALLVVGSLFVAFPPQDKIHQGLDIEGGLSVVLSAKAEDGQRVTPEDMEKAKSIIETRVNALGASEASVQIQGDNQILVQIPGLSDSSAALDTIGKTGVLEFARLDSFTDETTKSNIESGNIIDYTSISAPEGEMPTGAVSGLTDYTDAKHITVPSGTYTPLFTGDHISQVTIGKESDTSQYYSVNLRLDPEASSAFATASTELLPTNGKIVILLDGEVNSAPAIQSAITTGEVAITGNYSLEDARALQTVLDSGSLPVSFEYEQSQTVGPTLGQGELAAGLLAMMLGIVIVMVYLLAFYRGFGLVPAANMIVFAIVYLGVLGVLSAFGLFSLSLAGIAGIMLSIGMTADSVILAIEKFKEELKEGRSVRAASEKGIKHALITSVDADVVSLITALSLFFFATSSIKGFGLTLALGILCDITVMFLFVSPLIRLLAPHAMKYHPGFWGIKYALQLGDVRTDAHNYIDPESAKAAEVERREKKKEERERNKEAARRQRKNDRAADKRAKEIRKEKARDEKLAKKQKLAEIKAADAEKDAARKEAKKAARDASKARKDMDRAEKAEEKAVTDEKKAADDFADALDAEAKADVKFKEFMDKVKAAKTREEALNEETAASDTADRTPESDGTSPTAETEARTRDEIAQIIASTSGIGTIIVEESDELVREAQSDIATSAPAEDQDYGIRDDIEAVTLLPRKNRAQRRAEARADKHKN